MNTTALTHTLSELGIPCEFVGERQTPQLVKYDYNVFDLVRYPLIERYLPALSARFKQPFSLEPSTVGDFCLVTPREPRYIPRLVDIKETIKGLAPGDVLFGVDNTTEPLIRNILDTRSILVAGTSGSGKSTLLHGIIKSLVSAPADKVRLTLIDLKKCEFAEYSESEHLDYPVAQTICEATTLLRGIKRVIDHRYIQMTDKGQKCADIDEFPLHVCIIDEYAELTLQSRNKAEIDRLISSIASMGRACNVFLIIATQHAISTILNNTIKSNIQTRIGLRTTNTAQSMCILDVPDCKSLLGSGDCLISFDGESEVIRAQVCDISEKVETAAIPYNDNAVESPLSPAKPATEKPQRKEKPATRKLEKIIKSRDTKESLRGYAVKDEQVYLTDGFFCARYDNPITFENLPDVSEGFPFGINSYFDFCEKSDNFHSIDIDRDLLKTVVPSKRKDWMRALVFVDKSKFQAGYIDAILSSLSNPKCYIVSCPTKWGGQLLYFRGDNGCACLLRINSDNSDYVKYVATVKE